MIKVSQQNSRNSFKNDLVTFLKDCCIAIKNNTDDVNIIQGVDEFTAKLHTANVKENVSATQLPALAQLHTLKQTPYLSNFQNIATQMKWRPSPRTDYGAEVMALCALNEMLVLGDIVAGLVFMTPEQVYPEHKHPPQELYFVLSGNGSWMFGGDDRYTHQTPGNIIYNKPHDLHGIKTQEESLLALYILWGDKTQGYRY